MVFNWEEGCIGHPSFPLMIRLNMRMSRKRCGGFSLVEVEVSIMVLLIAITGAIGFNHYSMIDVYKSQARSDACMLGAVIMECWQGQGGLTTFNPVNNLPSAIVNCGNLDIRYSVIGPSAPSGFTIVWNNLIPYYRISTNNVIYRVVLSYKMISGKKYLNVCVAWQNSRVVGFNESNSFVGITESLN